MRVFITAIIGALAAGCATLPALEVPATRVEAGEQLRPWGIELHAEGEDLKIDGYVTHVQSVRPQLEEHVHVEVVASDGTIVHTTEAQVSIRTNHPNESAIPLHARIPAEVVQPGSVVVVRVVRNTNGDRGA